MKRAVFSFLLLIITLSVHAQDDFRISKPESTFSNNVLTILYDITGCGSGQYIDISLIVLNSKGDTLRPQSISGDMGKMISCGFGKKIEWNIVRDNLRIDEDIQIMVIGQKSLMPVSNMNISSVRKIGRGNVLLSSLFIPGYGQKKASGKPVYFIFSGLVYGSAGASIYLNIRSKHIYKDYEKATGSDRDILYDKSLNDYDLSRYLLYGAAGTWVANIIWSAVIPIKENPLKKTKITLTSTRPNELLVSAKWNF